MQPVSKDTRILFKQLKKTMKEQGITAYQVHIKTGLPKRTVYDLLNNATLESHIEKLLTICNAIGKEIVLIDKVK